MNCYRMPAPSGAVEGLNNKAKLISRKAYGFRTAKSYIRNLYYCMAQLFFIRTCKHSCDEPFFALSSGRLSATGTYR